MLQPMRILLLAIILYALPPTACRPPPRAPSSTITIGGHLYGVVRLEGWISENASNAGGTHYTFSIDGMPRDRLVHGGGHAWLGDGVALPTMIEMVDNPWPHPYYVAELTLDTAPIDRPCPETWCSDPMPTYYGEARRLVPAASLDAARAMLAAIPRTGYPAGEINIRPY